MFPLEKVSTGRGGARDLGKNKYWDNFNEDVLRPDISKS
jgi:hypothetical protein